MEVTEIPYQDLVPLIIVVGWLEKSGWANVNVRREEEFIKEYARLATLPGFVLLMLLLANACSCS